MKARGPVLVPFAAGDDDVRLDYGEHPHTVQRHCTDCPCCLLFLVAMAAFSYVLLFAFANGDPNRFLGLPNTDGQFCGVSDGVVEKPYLYFCQSTHFPGASICVSECPDPLDGSSLQSDCPDLVPDYRTRPLGGLLCMPRDSGVALQTAQAWNRPAFKWLLQMGSLFRNWELILFSGAASVVMGFAYLFLLEECASCIVWTGLLTVVGVLASFGVYLVQSSLRLGADGLPGTGDGTWDFCVGVGLCAFSLSFACLGCWQAENAGAAIACIQEASECIGDMRTLLFQPFFEVLCKSVLTAALGIGFLFLASCTQFAPHKEVLGQSFTLEFDPEDYTFITFYAFMSLWMLEICGAVSQFVISYTTQLWFFATRNRRNSFVGMPVCPTCQGYVVGICYHLGTLAYGSFVLTTVRVARDIMLFVTTEAAGSGNQVVACCGCCCACCLECFKRFLRFMTRNAYMDTAINSNDFCKAAYHAGMILTHYSSEVATLNAATVVFQIAGFGGIAVSGGILAHFMCTRMPRYCEESSPHFVEYPLIIDVASAAVSALVAWPFLALLDRVSDTLVFCAAVEKMRTPPPAALQEDSDEEGGCACIPARGRSASRRSEYRDLRDPEAQALLPRW